MKVRNQINIEKRCLSLKEAAAYMGIGTTNCRKLMDKIGATMRIGERVVFDIRVIDSFLDNEAKGGTK